MTHTDNCQSLQCTVNGQLMTIQAKTLTALLCQLALKDTSVVAEVNGQIVPKESFACFRLREGDRVELVHFVGGG